MTLVSSSLDDRHFYLNQMLNCESDSPSDEHFKVDAISSPASSLLPGIVSAQDDVTSFLLFFSARGGEKGNMEWLQVMNLSRSARYSLPSSTSLWRVIKVAITRIGSMLCHRQR